MAAGSPALRVTGAKEVAAALRAASGSGKEMGQAHKRVAEIVAPAARARALAGSAQQASAVSAIKASAKQTGVSINLSSSKGVPYAVGAFMGSNRLKQFPKWVGTDWQLPDSGPYRITDAIREKLPEVEAAYGNELVSALRNVGLDTSALKAG